MKMKTKAIYAGVAGLSLLTATGGSLALFHAADSLDGASVSTGALDLVEHDRSWTWEHEKTVDGQRKVDRDLETLPAVVNPGDRLTGTTTIDATLEGRTIEARLDAAHAFGGNDWLDNAEVVLTLDGVVVQSNRPGLTEAAAPTREQSGTAIPVQIDILVPATGVGADPVDIGLGSVDVTLVQTPHTAHRAPEATS